MNIGVSQILEASRVLFRADQKRDALLMLRKLWEETEMSSVEEFKVFCALIEVWSLEQPHAVVEFLDGVMNGSGHYHEFWLRRSLSEQALLLDWQGQIAYYLKDKAHAFESLGRAASLGRDTHLLWRQLGSLYIEQGDLELGLRYVRRSLQLYRQLDFNLLSGKEDMMGGFSGKAVVKTQSHLEDYLELLLLATKVARGQRNLKGVRELVMEMIHQFPREERLPKIRLLLDRAIVESSLQYTAVVGKPTPSGSSQAALRLPQSRGPAGVSV